MDPISSAYYALFIMYFFVSIVGAIGIAAVDSSKGEEGRLAPQH